MVVVIILTGIGFGLGSAFLATALLDLGWLALFGVYSVGGATGSGLVAASLMKLCEHEPRWRTSVLQRFNLLALG